MCLPPKTGCTNWQRGMVSLLKNGDTSPEELSDYEVFYDLERFNSTDMRKERMIRGSQQGYLTMVNTRHPLARLLSAWHDKFRKGHPWLKFIESKYGDILKILERRDMTLEKYAYSFESFMELAAASNHDWMRFVAGIHGLSRPRTKRFVDRLFVGRTSYCFEVLSNTTIILEINIGEVFFIIVHHVPTNSITL